MLSFLVYYQFFPANAVGFTSGDEINLSLEKKQATELSAYITNTQKIGTDLTLQYGVRYSYFNN